MSADISSRSSNSWPRRVAYLTSGAAGMFCGSCLHDNTLARALSISGVDTVLVPTYTPIRTDEQDVSLDRVFFGGISVYLEQKFPPFRWLPRWSTRWLDHPKMLGLVTRWGMNTSAADLGALTVSMLRGEHGHQRREVEQLVRWLADSLRPDLVCLSNVLIAGFIPALKEACDCPVLVTLQGDDIFLDDLPAPFQQQAETEIRRLVASVDGFLFHSQFYAQRMAARFNIPQEKIRRIPLGIEAADFESCASRALAAPGESLPAAGGETRTIGYLARLAPEKGLHQLVDAFLALRRRPGNELYRLKIAGWLGAHRRAYAEEQFQRLRDAGLEQDFEYVGEVDRAGKVRFLESLDLLCVPTVYEEPKGLFVLEALAAGVPVVLPAHGAFPELIAATGGGLLVPPGNVERLADEIAKILGDDQLRRRLAAAGRAAVLGNWNAQAMAQQTLSIFRGYRPNDPTVRPR